MKEQAKVATAPPVASPLHVPALRETSTVQNWKARLKGTLADDEPNPDVADLTPAQQAAVMELLAAIVAGSEKLACIQLNWSFLNAQAKGSRSTLRIAGIEAFDAGGTRAKGRR